MAIPHRGHKRITIHEDEDILHACTHIIYLNESTFIPLPGEQNFDVKKVAIASYWSEVRQLMALLAYFISSAITCTCNISVEQGWHKDVRFIAVVL